VTPSFNLLPSIGRREKKDEEKEKERERERGKDVNTTMRTGGWEKSQKKTQLLSIVL
jgi:hypothetical protein